MPALGNIVSDFLRQHLLGLCTSCTLETAGLEPTTSACKATILPLKLNPLGSTGLEPASSTRQTKTLSFGLQPPFKDEWARTTIFPIISRTLYH